MFIHCTRARPPKKKTNVHVGFLTSCHGIMSHIVLGARSYCGEYAACRLVVPYPMTQTLSLRFLHKNTPAKPAPFIFHHALSEVSGLVPSILYPRS